MSSKKTHSDQASAADTLPLDMVLSAFPVAYLATDARGRVTSWNEKLAEITGVSAAHMIGKKAWRGFSEEKRLTPMELTLRTEEAEDQPDFEIRNRQTGEAIRVRFAARPVLDAQDELLGVVGMLAVGDTDELMTLKAETADLVPLPIIAMDREYKVTYANDAAVKLLGHTQESVLGHFCYDLFKTTHCNTAECRCRQAMDRDGVFTGETSLEMGGRTLYIEYTGAPVKDGLGKIIGAREFVLDITQRKEVLTDIIRMARELASGNLTVRARDDYEGDYKEIADQLNRAVKAQHDAMLTVAEAVEQLSAASEQIASGSQYVAQGAATQASSLQQTSASLDEMSTMTARTAEHTQRVQTLSEATRETASQGSEAMKQMTAAMEEIRKAAESTAEIIRDINEIAFQTNLLALNAAVEAARAGDAGRGFAVVAEEVRNLAQRSKEAAKRTEQLIKESVNLAESGRDISGKVDANLGDIVDSILRVAELIGQIATSSVQQADGIKLVNDSMNKVDKVTQQAAANAEESASSAEELSSQAQELARIVGRFTLLREGRATHAAPPTPKAPAPQVDWERPAPRVPTKGLRGKDPNAHFSAEDLIPLEDDPEFKDF